MKSHVGITILAVLLLRMPVYGREAPVRRDSLSRTPVIAFRSNLLVPLMNVGVEVPISDRISLEADFYSPWALREWVDGKLPARQCCFQFVSGTVGCRFRNLSIGIVASGGIYDFERNWKGQQGEFAFLGVDYLYGLPSGKGGVLFEFNVGLGCGINRFNNYEVKYEGGRLINDGGRHIRFIPVPIRLGVSVAVPVFKKHKYD